jgi:zinc protease
VSFHGPAFSDTSKDFAAMDLGMDLAFGPTSDIYRKLVEQEQKVDQFFGDIPLRKDPPLLTVGARVKDPADAVYVRDEILRTFARLREARPPSSACRRPSRTRYGFVRRLDNTSIASTLASFVSIERDYDTLNDYFRVYETLTPADLQAVARRYFTDEGLVVTTLSQAALP